MEKYMTLVINQSDAFFNSVEQIGGKAKNLSNLHYYNIPSWVVLPTNSFDYFLKENQIQDQFIEILNSINSESDTTDLSNKLKSLIEEAKIPKILLNEINKFIKEDQFYSVRSSAVDEDGKNNSFAGILESYLFQKGIDSIELAIKKCFQSCFSERALKYRLNRNVPIKDASIAVILQEMIPSEKSGVLFCANPTTGARDEFAISANFGLGEGVVSGECETDEYLYSLSTKRTHTEKKKKDFYFIQDGNGNGAIKTELPEELKEKDCLSTQEINQLIEVSIKITRDRKRPQDIEWAFYEGQLYILQTRDITSLLPPKKSNSQNIVFDNSNIQESYCGVTSPLTFSYANEAYFRVYHQMLSIMGLKESLIKQHEKRHWNMISLIKGRVYYNINSWYDGLLLFPSFENNKDSMEKMMGLQDPVDFIKDKKMSTREKLHLLPTVFRCYWNLIKYFIQIDNLVQNFTKDFSKEYSYFDRKNFCFKDLGELFDLTDRIINKITSKWQAPIINDFYVMTYHGKAQRFLEKHGIQNPEIKLSNLLSGEEDIQSTEPTKQLLKITDHIRLVPGLKEFILKTEVQKVSHLLKDYTEIQTLCENYIESYGDRVIGELKLESISLREDPTFMYRCISTYLDQGMNLDAYSSNEKVLRIKTEKEIFTFLKKNHGSKKLTKFKSLLKNTRKGVKYRENMRLIRTRVFGLSRDLYLEMGRQLETYGKLDDSRDIFYLTLDELERYRMGRSVQTNLKNIISSRKTEYKTYEDDEPAYHFHTAGPVYLREDYKYPYERSSSADLKGLGCYPGIIEEEVCLMNDPTELVDIKGKILCTVRTDPGWAPIFPMIKGLIVERGSMLSHSAVIARELGIPTIVGVPDITKKLKTGQKIKMDGEIGTVDLID
jgi:phosphohistidine swiveling domain-containing protein